MSRKIQLTIPEPCHENWENMLPAEQGRFCNACCKQVIDFSRMTDREIAQFLKKPSTGSLCGRFMNEQLNRDLEIPKKRIPWVRYFFQFALPAFLASGKLMAQGRIKMKGEPVQESPKEKKDGSEPENRKTLRLGTTSKIVVEQAGMEDTVHLKQLSETASSFQNKLFNAAPALPTQVFEGSLGGIFIVNEAKSTIRGIVIDPEGKPLPYASISIKNSRQGVIADEQGKFSITPNKYKNKPVLSISSVGYLTKEITVRQNIETEKELVVQLESNPLLQEVVVTTGYVNRKKSSTSGSVAIIRKSWTASFREWIQSSVKPMIYPNPVKSSSSISIKLLNKEEGSYLFEFLALNGQLIHRLDMWVDREAAVVDMQIPGVRAGTYLLKMRHEKSGKVFTEKIVVQ